MITNADLLQILQGTNPAYIKFINAKNQIVIENEEFNSIIVTCKLPLSSASKN